MMETLLITAVLYTGWACTSPMAEQRAYQTQKMDCDKRGGVLITTGLSWPDAFGCVPGAPK